MRLYSPVDLTGNVNMIEKLLLDVSMSISSGSHACRVL